jgi:hypothetical protein
METVKKITTDQVKALIQAQIDRENQSIYLHNEIVKVLKNFEGKAISKRIATALQKIHPDWTVFYDTNYGMFHLSIWGGDTGLKYDSRYSALIGYESEPEVSIGESKYSRGFEYFDCCNGSAAIERNIARQATIDNPVRIEDMVKALNDYSESLANLEKTIDADTDSYNLIRLAYNGKYGTWHE